MPDLGIDLPAGHRLVSYAERPDLVRAADRFNGSVWPEFMLQDTEADRYWGLLETDFREFQLVLLDEAGSIAATNNSAPLAWNGRDDGLPGGWDRQFEQSARDLAEGRDTTTLGALQIVVDPARRGTGLAATMIRAMRANATAHGLDAVIACVRPTAKERYPLAPIERYVQWVRADGQPFDPWIRLHVRLGGRVVRGVPGSMRIRGSVADWERWTGMAFPESGEYVVQGAAATVRIDRERDEGLYLDPNVWVVHAL